MLFQIYDLINLLQIIVYFLLISGYLFIAISGAFNLRREEKYNGAVFFVIIGAVELIYEAMRWHVYNWVYYVMGYSPFSVIIVEAIMSVIPYFISIITFGVFFLILWKKNSENHGKILLISGIFWIVYSVVMFLIYFLAWDLFPLTILYIISQGVVVGVSILMIVSRIFLLVYATKIKEKFLIISSIFLLNASIIIISLSGIYYMNYLGLIPFF
ncbi:MAG: hypothetical protein EAX91_18025 [Candidatus Lokiarchaeota archaeon]|nr:hypothetical protein [Candidatus Lokiarchaeota archaeon]